MVVGNLHTYQSDASSPVKRIDYGIFVTRKFSHLKKYPQNQHVKNCCCYTEMLQEVFAKIIFKLDPLTLDEFQFPIFEVLALVYENLKIQYVLYRNLIWHFLCPGLLPERILKDIHMIT